MAQPVQRHCARVFQGSGMSLLYTSTGKQQQQLQKNSRIVLWFPSWLEDWKRKNEQVGKYLFYLCYDYIFVKVQCFIKQVRARFITFKYLKTRYVGLHMYACVRPHKLEGRARHGHWTSPSQQCPFDCLRSNLCFSFSPTRLWGNLFSNDKSISGMQ